MVRGQTDEAQLIRPNVGPKIAFYVPIFIVFTILASGEVKNHSFLVLMFSERDARVRIFFVDFFLSEIERKILNKGQM